MSKELNFKKYETKLEKLYPSLDKNEIHEIIKLLFTFWSDIIEAVK